MEPETVTDTVITVRGDVDETDIDYVRDKVETAQRLARGPVLFARVELDRHTDPARAGGAFAKAELDVDGTVVRARAAAGTMREAIDALDTRLRERLERQAHRERDAHLRHRDDAAHEWRHGSEPTVRADYFPRPTDERDVVRRKSFAVGAMTVDEAIADLEALDHDFYLFRNVDTGEDALVARTDDGRYELHEDLARTSSDDVVAPVTRSPVRPPEVPVDEARGELDETDRLFVFFVDPDDGRGRVLYRRYDGHYGLIEPSEVK